MERILSVLKRFSPVEASMRVVGKHPRLAAWTVLSMGICLVLAIGGRDARLPLGPWLVLFAVGILTAGWSIKLVTGDDDGDETSA